MAQEPYYQTIKDVRTFLKYYLTMYRSDYHSRRARAIISLFPPPCGKKVLEVGCGGGFYSLATAKSGCQEIILTDVQQVCVRAAKLNIFEHTGSKADGIICDALYLPFRDESFDLVLCSDVIEHLDEDQAFLKQISRVLKKGGLSVVATQSQNSINYFLEATMQRKVLKRREWMGWDPTHQRFYTPKSLSNVLCEADLKVVKIVGTYFIPYMLAYWLDRINGQFSKALYLLLRNFNDKLESRPGTIWNSFGWGIAYLCIKDLKA